MMRWHRLIPLCLLALATQVSAQMPVSVVRPTVSESTETLRFTGNLTARKSARLSPQVSGLIAAIHADAGDVVKQGDLLLELDKRLVSLDVARARAMLQEAEAELVEARRLAEEGRRLANDRFLPSTEMRAREAAEVLAEAARDRVRSELDREREQLALHQLRAPFSGVLSSRLVERGEWIEPGSAVAELVQVDELWLDVRVPQRYWADVGQGAVRVRAWADVAPDRELDTEVHARVPVSDATARTFLLRLLVHDETRAITPGMSAQVEIELVREQPTTRIPRDALVRYPDGTTTVWIVPEESNRASERAVSVLRYLGQEAELTEALPTDARVVVRGNEVLSEGDTVQLVEDGR